MTCTLYGQVDIELSGTKEIEVVLEGELSAVQLKGRLNIALESMQNIYLGGIMNDPNLEAGLGLVLNLEACIETENDYVNIIAKGCCNEDDPIVVQVLSNSVPAIVNEGFIYNGKCYIFSSNGGTNPVTTILPEQYIYDPCNDPLCPECLTPTPTPTPTITPSVVYNIHRLASCCNNPTEFNYYASIPSNWLIGNTVIADDGQCYVIGAPSIGTINLTAVSYNPFGCEDCISANPCPSSTPTPSVTNTVTPTTTPSITVTPTLTPTPTSSVSYTNWGAKECCNDDLIIVQVLTNNQPTALTEGFIYNGECYLFSGPGGSNPVTTILPEDYNNDPCNNPSCPSCPSPTPTPSTTPPCTTCDQYSISNNDKNLTLQISYTDCDTGESVGVSVLPDTSIVRCSCDTPVRTGGTNNYVINNQGSCP
jgi:hypothetical protein